MPKKPTRAALSDTAAALDEDLTQHAHQLLAGTGLNPATAAAVAAGHPAPAGTDPAVVDALRHGWANAHPITQARS